MKTVDLTEDQNHAIDLVMAWAKQPKAKKVFKVFGPAGTGKTTMAKTIGEQFDKVLYLAFTGKATLNLQQKGCLPASTIHKAIYTAEQDDLTGRWHYTLNYNALRLYDLVIVDEGPMVGRELAMDLLACTNKVLVLGDPYQLPPVEDDQYFGLGEPDYLLSEIHRQAKDDPIIALSMIVRGGGVPKPGVYGSSRVLKARDFSLDMLLAPDQILVGRNTTRHFHNKNYRIQAGLQERYGPAPGEGERLICLRNDYERGFMNGGMYTVAHSEFDGDDVQCMIVPEDSEGVEPVPISTPIEYFEGQEQSLPWTVRKNCNEFCFGRVITTHKAQGSQWPEVMVFDQGKVFKEDAFRWRYTAVTRASERLTMFVE